MSEPAGPRHYQLGPMTLAFKACEAEVDGAYSLIESIEPPGASVALHRHPSWQETFVVLEGRFDFEVAGAQRMAIVMMLATRRTTALPMPSQAPRASRSARGAPCPRSIGCRMQARDQG